MPYSRSLASGVIAALLLVSGVPAGAVGPAAPEVGVARVLALPGFDEDAAAEAPVDITSPRYPYALPRAGADRPDAVTGRQIHVVYLVPKDYPDEQLDTLGVIEDSMRSSNLWMKQQTGKQWRLDTYTFTWDNPATTAADPINVSAVDVTFIKSTAPSAALDSVGEVESELIKHSLRDDNKRYLSYVASNAGGVCGEAWYPFTGDGDGQYSTVYLNSVAGCRAKEFAPNATTPSHTETIAIQEMIHNDGMVPIGAPHGCGPLGIPAHVCTPAALAAPQMDPEWTDVMFPFVGLPLSQKFIDKDHLDYYGHPYPLRDLDTSVYLENA
jgi:hypothetical protein